MKKTFVTLALVTVMTFGATFANAGSVETSSPCTTNSKNNDGIIIFNRDGIIIFGIIIFGKDQPKDCETVSKDGILVSDSPNAGILVSD